MIYNEPEEMTEDITEDLIQSLKEQLEQEKEERRRRLDVFGSAIAKIRDEAVKARKESGIETIWQEDQDYYEGVDEFNRNESRYTKPRNDTGGLQRNRRDRTDNQCTAFFPLTAPFVDAASARMGDILLPSGDWNWSIKKSPVPEALQAQEGDEQIISEEISRRQKAEETRIKDWLTAGSYHRHNRNVIESAVRLGTGVLKGPFPVKKKIKTFVDGALVIQEEIVPTSKCVDVADFFPDMNCGENVQDGQYVFEREYLSAKQLQELVGLPGYEDDQINKVIEEGPGKRYAEADNRIVNDKTSENDLFEVWNYYGSIDVNDLDLINEEQSEESDKEYQAVVLTLVNDTVIKGGIDVLDNGEFPYDVICWQRREKSPFGIGVARQGRPAQKLMLSAGRSLVDNMSISSIPMIALRRAGVEPVDGRWEIKKGKAWWITDETVSAINQAIQFMTVPSLQAELTAVMELAGKKFEEATGVNFLLQGQQGAAPDTVGGMQLLHQNASSLLRRVARVYDENITEPHIRRYHDWHLIYGEDDEKGDLEIEAIGSSALVEREIQAMQMQVILQLSQDPNTGYSPKKTADEIVRSMKLEPSRFEMDEEEKQGLQERMAAAQEGQAQDPRLQIAELKAQTDMQIAEMRLELEAEKVRVDTDRDIESRQSMESRERMTYEMRVAELQMKRELAMLDYANKHEISLEQIKAKLASDALKINLQRELSAGGTKPAEQVLTPPSEPVGRAPDGQAFQK